MKKYGSMKHKPEWSKTRNTLGKVIFLVSLGGNAIAVVTGGTISLIAEKYYNSTPVAVTGTLIYNVLCINPLKSYILGEVQGGLPSVNLPPFSTTWNGTYYSFEGMLIEYGSLLAFCPLIAFLEHIAIVKAFSMKMLRLISIILADNYFWF